MPFVLSVCIFDCLLISQSLWRPHSFCASNYRTPSLRNTQLPAKPGSPLSTFLNFWLMVTGFDKREASVPVDSLAKYEIGVPFIHFLWFTRCCLKLSDFALLGTSHLILPPPYLVNGLLKVQIFYYILKLSFWRPLTWLKIQQFVAGDHWLCSIQEIKKYPNKQGHDSF